MSSSYSPSVKPARLALIAAITFGLVSAVARPSFARPSFAASYRFIGFDGPGDHAGGTTVNGINNLGDVVGFSANAGATVLTNFISDAVGNFTPLDLGAATAMANGMNTFGAVVGGSGTNAFLMTKGRITPLPPANPGKTASEVALGLNDAGSIVGQYMDSASGKTPGFIDVGGTFTLINPTPDAMVTNVQGLNNRGQAIGFYSKDGVHQHGFVYQLTTGQTTLLPDPSTARTASMGLTLTQFLGINDNEQAVGYYQTNDGSQFGFLFDLNTQTYTFLDAPQAAPVNGVQITQITGINDRDEIAGFFVDGGGAQHGFVAMPQ